MEPEARRTFVPREMPRAKSGAAENTLPRLDLACGRKKVTALFLGSAPRPIVWVHMPAEAAAETAKLLAGERLVLAAVTDADWERELSPWSARRAFKGGKDFGGGADEYLTRLTAEIIPQTERALEETPLWRGISGYSLAGLFAVYAAWKTETFSRFASVSGSLWYDGFTDYLCGNAPEHVPERAYFSVGSLEKNTKNARLATVEECTLATAARFEALGAKTTFEKNEGGHFSGAEERTARAIRWLLR